MGLVGVYNGDLLRPAKIQEPFHPWNEVQRSRGVKLTLLIHEVVDHVKNENGRRLEVDSETDHRLMIIES
jgi:hypothetical protein